MRTNQDRISYRQSVLSFVNLQRFSSPFAVTLTLKQGIAGAGGLAGRYQKIDMYEVRKNFRHFMNFLRSEEHTSELQSLMRISYAVFCLKKKIEKNTTDK